jgi:hypothetical protein
VTAERGGGSGRRDPALRERIRRDQPIYTDEAPDGVVGVRPPDDGNEYVPEGDEGQQIDLSQLTDEEYNLLVEQGIIADGDEGTIEIDRGEITDEVADPEDFPMLLPGDVVYAKVHHPVRFDDDPSNFSYGVASRVQPEETEEDAFERIEPIVNTRSLQMAQRAAEPLMKFKDDVDKARKEQLNGRRGLRPRGERESE